MRLGSSMRRLISCAILLLSLSPAFSEPGIADLEEGAFKAYGAKDYVSAATLWSKAAKKGSSNAKHRLAGLYLNGHGVVQDMARAHTLEAEAAKAGHVDAQYSLGQLYAHGFGVKQDYTKALAWYQKAAEQGHGEAKLAAQWVQREVVSPAPAVPSGRGGFLSAERLFDALVVFIVLSPILIILAKPELRAFLVNPFKGRVRGAGKALRQKNNNELMVQFRSADPLVRMQIVQVLRGRNIPLKRWITMFNKADSIALSNAILELIIIRFPDTRAAKDFYFDLLEREGVLVQVKATAAVALREYKTDDVVDRLEALGRSTSLGAAVRRKSIDALAGIGSRAAGKALVSLLLSGDTEAQFAAEDGLVQNPTTQNVELLQEALAAHTDRDHGIVLIKTLVMLERKRRETGEVMASQKAFLDSLMRYPTGWVGGAAAEALGEFKVVESLDPLLEALETLDANIRLKAVVALGQLGRKEALPRLKEVLSDDMYPEIRVAAELAITALEGGGGSA